MANNRRYSSIDLSRYNSGYQPSARVNDALRKKQDAENAVANYGNFNYTNQGAYDSVINDILNRKDFSYDMNADAFYQQYKDQYMALGKLAMDDTIGKAAAMTGGYGNSYAVSAGSQAYQEQLDQLNDKIPELWALARTAYENDRAADYDKYNMLLGDRKNQYGEWTDGLNRLLNERGYYSDNYNNAYSQDYTEWADKRDFDQNQYWNEFNAGYQAERDAVEDARFQQQFNENVRQYNEQMTYKNAELAAKASGSSSGNSLKNPTDAMFKEALELYNSGGEAALDDFFDRHPGYNNTLIMEYCATYGDVANSMALSDRTWTVTDDGGWNWGWGVDNNAELTDHYGNTYTAKDLRDALMKDGMTESQANEFLKKYGVYS